MIRLYKLLYVFALLLLGCEKDPIPPAARRPDVSTSTQISGITINSANVSGTVTSNGGAVLLSRGICWSTNINPTIDANKIEVRGGMGLFTTELTGLATKTTYYVRAYATNTAGTSYGNQVAFTTLGIPVIVTSSISSITTSSAIGGGTISSNGGSTITAKGICWSSSMNPTIALSTKTSNGSGNGSFSASMTGLSTKTTYYVRAYATNSAGTSYGDQVTFTTVGMPVVVTSPISSITTNSAIGGGAINNNGGSTITAKGICWSTSMNPTITLSTKTSNGSGDGSFSASMTGLSIKTTYYVRAYATNSAGTSYGDQFTFTTLGMPLVVTSSISSITASSAIGGGSISSNGGSTITAKGICWSTSMNPTIALSTKTSNGSGDGSFSASITGLSTKTTYYVRAYATNSAGTSYGDQVTFTTIGLPAVITSSISSITTGSAIGGGSISSNSGSTITAKGICWSTSMNPTIALSTKTSNGSGNGSFGASMTGLSTKTTYYVRAWATNAAGTSYGSNISFRTN